MYPSTKLHGSISQNPVISVHSATGTSAALYTTLKCWNVTGTCLRVLLQSLQHIGFCAYFHLYNIEVTLKLYVCQFVNCTGRQMDNEITKLNNKNVVQNVTVIY
jgi:hypothetical protein